MRIERRTGAVSLKTGSTDITLRYQHRSTGPPDRRRSMAQVENTPASTVAFEPRTYLGRVGPRGLGADALAKMRGTNYHRIDEN